MFCGRSATANIMAKMAHGIADDMVSSTFLAATCPVLVCPAMNTNMYENAATQVNLRILEERGMKIVGPGVGKLACLRRRCQGRSCSGRSISWTPLWMPWGASLSIWEGLKKERVSPGLRALRIAGAACFADGFYFAFPQLGHRSRIRGHVSHLGLRALQNSRPKCTH